jgi:DNA-binding MarR family transcriptional regulator
MPSKPDPVTRAQYDLLADFRHQMRLFARFSEEAARAAGLTPAQHQALLAVKGAESHSPMSIGDLAERLCVRHHSAVGLVDRLIRGKLLRRVPDVTDRRRIHLVLTARGERVLARLSAAHRDELRRIGPHVEDLLARLRSDGKARPRA